MSSQSAVADFITELEDTLNSKTFLKLVLSKPSDKNADLRNIYARQIVLRNQAHLSFTLRYTNKDITQNYTFDEAIPFIKEHLGQQFLNADLFATTADISIKYNKKRIARLFRKAASIQQKPSTQHNKEKQRFIKLEQNVYLKAMGITGKDAIILKNGQRKFRQINKYIEIIDSLLRQKTLSEQPHIVDMGSGKGYLTFALYDYLEHNLQLSPTITGIELRKNLVQFCNNLAKEAQFNHLNFLAKDIHEYQPEKIDMLIALHACDIATDIAIAKGIKANAEIIVVAPCCHKQVRKDMSSSTNSIAAVLKHGILEERQAELLTDGIRALLLEAHGYKTKVFEFISSEHTSKNLMITAQKGTANSIAIKEDFGIKKHYLETLLL